MDTPPGRFDAFDGRARHALVWAREESEREGLSYIGTEQLLLGLLVKPGSAARRVLRNFGIELDSARVALRRLRPVSSERVPAEPEPMPEEVGLTPTGKRMLELALDEARALGHTSVGTEHLLLGLLGVGEGALLDILEQRGVNPAAVRSRTLQVARGQASRPTRREASIDPNLAGIEPFELRDQPRLRVQLKNNVVMCRVDDADMDAIDMLIEAGVRANRSDAAGWLIKAGLESKRAVLDSVRDKVLEIRRIREDARALAEHAQAKD